MAHLYYDKLTCFDDPGSIQIHSDWMTGRPFRSIVIAIEKCRPSENLTCATDKEVDDWFENNPVKFKTGYLKFARNVFADN
jgi:hypothetical protein